MLRGNPGARGVIDRQLDIQTDNIYIERDMVLALRMQMGCFQEHNKKLRCGIQNLQ